MLQFPPTHWPGGRYSFLLIALLLMFAVDPLVHGHWVGAIVLDVLTAIVLLSAVLSLGNRKVVLIIGIALATPEVLATLAAWLFDGQGSLGAGPGGTLRAIVAICFFTYMAAVVMNDVVRGGNITGDNICAAACVYLMIGLVWAFVYLLIEHYSPDSFHVGDRLLTADVDTPRELFSLLIYFSFVTLTTLGFGDITPISAPARTACWLEAIIGQLFLATFVAGLVGIHIAHHFAKKRM